MGTYGDTISITTPALGIAVNSSGKVYYKKSTGQIYKIK